MNYQSVLAPLIENTFNTVRAELADYVRLASGHGMGYFNKQPFVTGGLLVRFGWSGNKHFNGR